MTASSALPAASMTSGATLGIALNGAGLSAGLRWTAADRRIRTNLLIVEDGGRDAQQLLVTLQQLLRACRLTLDDLTGVAFAAGPGSFTRVRLACAVAQGIALGRGIPVTPVDDMAIIARAALAGTSLAGQQKVLVLVDARMGEVFAACFSADAMANGIDASAGLLTVQDIGRWVQSVAAPAGANLFAGDAFDRLGPALAAQGVPAALGERVTVDAQDAMLALLDLAAAGPRLAAREAAPRYVREKVALDVHEQALLRAGKAGPAEAG